MMKYTLVFIGLSLSFLSQSVSLEKCHTSFKSGSSDNFPSAEKEWIERPDVQKLIAYADNTGAYMPQSKERHVQELFSSVYKTLPFLGKYLSSLEIQNHNSSLEKTMDLLASSSHSDFKSRLNLINPDLSHAIKAFPTIVSFITHHAVSQYNTLDRTTKPSQNRDNFSIPQYESLDIKTILKLILATYNQHLVSYLTHEQKGVLDWPRFSLILKSIAHFENQPNVFSLYKIKRIIKEKYSLQEYINCK